MLPIEKANDDTTMTKTKPAENPVYVSTVKRRSIRACKWIGVVLIIVALTLGSESAIKDAISHAKPVAVHLFLDKAELNSDHGNYISVATSTDPAKSLDNALSHPVGTAVEFQVFNGNVAHPDQLIDTIPLKVIKGMDAGLDKDGDTAQLDMKLEEPIIVTKYNLEVSYMSCKARVLNEKIETRDCALHNGKAETAPLVRRKLWGGFIITIVSIVYGCDCPVVSKTKKKRDCFSNDAIVTVCNADGTRSAVPISSVDVGMQVLDGSGHCSAVYLQGHNDFHAKTEMVTFSTKSGHVGTASPTHYIQSGNEHYHIQDVKVGMPITVTAANGTFYTSDVATVSKVTKVGLYNPYTLSGTILVDGVAFSCHSEWWAEGYMSAGQIVSTYQALLTPARTIFRTNPDINIEFMKQLDGSGIKRLDEHPVSEMVKAFFKANLKAVSA